jgi:hypothetical protein
MVTNSDYILGIVFIHSTHSKLVHQNTVSGFGVLKIILKEQNILGVFKGKIGVIKSISFEDNQVYDFFLIFIFITFELSYNSVGYKNSQTRITKPNLDYSK